MDLSSSSTDSQLIEEGRSPESQPLLPVTRPIIRITFKEKLTRANFLPQKLHLTSKSAVLILFWSLLVGAIYTIAKEGTNLAAYQLAITKGLEFFHSYDILLTRLIFVLVFLLYPFAGFLADVCCGRYRVIMISLCLLACGMALLSVDSIFLLTRYTVRPFSKSGHGGITSFYIIAACGLFSLIIGFAGYEANFIQFGIDQLIEAPSEYLGLFVHWVEWFTMLGTTFARITFSLIEHCNKVQSSAIYYMTLSLPLLFLTVLAVMLAFTYWKRRWFNIEAVRSNPYKMVYKVLNFAIKIRHPVPYSAYLGEAPSRLDSAKERYGGPFKTEQVEDIKTFLRILVILLALGPLFALEVPIGPILPIFIQHVIKQRSGSRTTCNITKIILDVSSLKSLITIVFFPIYVWFIYSVLRRCIPKIFTRIKIGVVALILGLMGLFLIELLGHILYSESHTDRVVCMFRDLEQQAGTKFNSSVGGLELPWPATLAPGFLTQAGITVIITTSFEFISAQSPHSMKGLLIGVMFLIRGIFQVLMAISVLPFSVAEIWGTREMKINPPPVFNCGFGYLLFTCIVGMVGLLLFLMAIKRYQYRERHYNTVIVQ